MKQVEVGEVEELVAGVEVQDSQEIRNSRQGREGSRVTVETLLLQEVVLQ